MSAIGKRSDGGFTLIETLVVVAITALISGLMFPRLQSLVSGQEFRMAVSALTLGVRETRALAIRSGAPARFAVSGDASGFRVAERTAQRLPSAVRLAPGARGGDIVFYPDGTSNGGRLTLAAPGLRQGFVIFPTTGLIALAAR